MTKKIFFRGKRGNSVKGRTAKVYPSRGKCFHRENIRDLSLFERGNEGGDRLGGEIFLCAGS